MVQIPIQSNENFKVINAPGVIKLLSLADLGGLADLAEGEGLSFDVHEIDYEKDQNFLKINEILALGTQCLGFNGRLSQIKLCW